MNTILKKLSLNGIMLLCLFLAGCQVKTLQDVSSEQITLSDNTKIVYKTYGSGNETIVFLHGFGCDINAWQHQFEYFSKDYKTVFIDLPGYGQSDKPRVEYSLDFYADAVKNVLDTLGVQKAVLIGHSLGTAICRQVIFDNPGLVSKMVDVDGVYCFFPEDSIIREQLEMQYTAFASMFDAPDIKETMQQFIQPLFIEQTPQSVKDYVMSTMPNTLQYIASSTMKNLILEKYWTNEIITIPSLIIAAKNSQIPPDYKDIMQMLYSDMQYEELDSVGHFIMMEQPEMFNDMVGEFIKK